MQTAELAIINDPKLVFDAERHLYFYDGVRVPSVTQLLKEYGLINFDGVPEDRLEYKRALGTAVHYAAYLFDKNDLDESTLDPRIKPYFNAYKKFREVTGFTPRFSEHRLYSKTWRFAGTMDLQGPFVFKGKEIEAIIDIKCSWEMYPSNGPQTEGYKILIEENYPQIKIKGRFGLQLKENGNYELTPYESPSDRQAFLSCTQIHHWRQQHKLIKETT